MIVTKYLHYWLRWPIYDSDSGDKYLHYCLSPPIHDSDSGDKVFTRLTKLAYLW